MAHIVSHRDATCVGFFTDGLKALREMEAVAAGIIRVCIHFAGDGFEPLRAGKLHHIIIENLPQTPTLDLCTNDDAVDIEEGV